MMRPAREASVRDYERSFGVGSATSDSVAGRCISAQGGDGDLVSSRRMPVSRCSPSGRA